MKHEKKHHDITRIHLIAWSLLVVAVAEVLFIPEISTTQLVIAYGITGLLLAIIVVCLAALYVFYFSAVATPGERPKDYISKFTNSPLEKASLGRLSRSYFTNGINKFLPFFRFFN
ncbi:MAG: hypothetical protein AAF990_24215 [Bacteroidota bacterium]